MRHRVHQLHHLVVGIRRGVEVVPPQDDAGDRRGGIAVGGGDDDVGRDERTATEVLGIVLDGCRVGIPSFRRLGLSRRWRHVI